MRGFSILLRTADAVLRASAKPALAVTLSFALAACISAKNDGKANKDAGAGSGGPQRGGMIKMPSNEPKYLNPILEPRFVVANALIFEGLVGLDAKVEPVKRLADSWTFSDDGRTLTFKLRGDVKWHDSKPFTSADVLFTYEAIKATTAASSWKAYLSIVQSVTAPDDATVVVTYTEPDARALTTWTLPILPKHVFGGTTDLTSAQANMSPIGTGPFKYVRWEPGKRIYLEANKEWWHKQPHLDGVELVFNVAEADALDALERGQLDWSRINDVDSWLRDAQTSEFRDGFEASEVVESRIRLIAWNTQRAPLDDKRVRKAMTHALDRGRVISDVLFGQAQPLSAPLFPNMFGYDTSLAPAPFDLEAARKLLDEVIPAKDDQRFAVEVIAVDSLRGPATDAMAAIFRSDLATLGIDFKLTILGSKDYYERIGRRDYDAVYFGWLPDIADPDPSALLDSSQAQTGANYAAYANPAIDKLLADARRTVDRDKRKALYEELQKLLAEEEPYTPLYAPFGRYAWSRKLHGVTPRDVGPMAPLPGVAGWWLGPK
jgi:peptide/nickel transport system substrate-binding protein